MWPACDSETGMFGGFYSAQLRNWLRVFDPSQFVIVPMDCYTSMGPSETLRTVSDVAGLDVGKSIGDLDRRFKPENEKRLKQLSASGMVAAQANRRGEQPIPLSAAKQLKVFFRKETDNMLNLLREFPRMRVINCGLTHFFRPCNTSYCRPSFDEDIAAIDEALEELATFKRATEDGGGLW